MKTRFLTLALCIIALFSVDLAYGYHPISPYAYVKNNPIRYVDPDGRMVGDFMDKKGRYLGTDGIDDGKLYVLKTTQSSVGNKAENTYVSAAGLSEAEARVTAKFITTNSGNTETFASNTIAYDNSVQIEGSATNRQSMIAEVSRDNGKGGTVDANNREYGGSIQHGKVIPVTPGAVASLANRENPSILVPTGPSTFHSHPSGTYPHANGSTSYFIQHPSPQDISVAGSQTHSVFGMGNNTVYIYNSQGVQATVPMNRFVTPKR